MGASRSPFNFDPRAAGPATKALCIATLLASIIFQITQKQFGFGLATFVYSFPEIFNLELWRLVTYPFMYTSGFGLLLGVLVLFLFGTSFESTYGTRDFIRFYAVSLLGAGIIALPLHILIESLGVFADIGVGVGAGPAIDAMLMALALTAPDSNILVGFVLPVKVRTAVFAFLIVQLVIGLMDGQAALSLQLGGLAMGYLLVTGNWRPSRWMSKRPRRGSRARTAGLYIVPPKRDDTLH